MKILLRLVFILWTSFAMAQTANQDKFTFPKAVKKDRYNIAVLSPMYLDSFNLAESYRNIPSFAAPGIDFYIGAELAADTLNKMKTRVTIHILDSKGKYMNLENLISGGTLDSADCIIGNIGGKDLETIALFAKTKKINFISAVSPNDAGQFFNPYFTLLQPRLSTHVQRIRKQIDLKYANESILFIHKDNESENNAFNYYKNDLITSKNKLIEMIQTDEVIDETALLARLTKDGENIIVLANLSPKVAQQNLELLSAVAKTGYQISVYGMPTWDNIKALKIPGELDNLDIYFTSPVLVDKVTQPYKYITKVYNEKMNAPIPDIAYKGFESVFYIANLLEKHGVPFNENISDNEPSFVTPYKITLVKEQNKLKYFENKFLYVVHYNNGTLTYE
jgi:hypothetical protein